MNSTELTCISHRLFLSLSLTVVISDLLVHSPTHLPLPPSHNYLCLVARAQVTGKTSQKPMRRNGHERFIQAGHFIAMNKRKDLWLAGLNIFQTALSSW